MVSSMAEISHVVANRLESGLRDLSFGERFRSPDGELETLNTRQMRFEPLAAVGLLCLAHSLKSCSMEVLSSLAPASTKIQGGNNYEALAHPTDSKMYRARRARTPLLTRRAFYWHNTKLAD